MGTAPSVLLLDDGELDDVDGLLHELEVPFARVRGSAIVKGTPPPRDLLVATPRRIDAVAETLAHSDQHPMRVMVVQEDSNALRERLRRNGFDYLVRRPVHPEALRLLLLHCLYEGEERRRDPRVPVGRETLMRAGLRSRRATLADLSLRGCRLLSRDPVSVGRRIRVWVPEALEVRDPICLRGRVARSEVLERNGEQLHALGVEFEPMREELETALKAVLEDRQRGPATLRSGCDGVPRRPDPRPPEPLEDPPPGPVAESRQERPPKRGVLREINAARPVPSEPLSMDPPTASAPSIEFQVETSETKPDETVAPEASADPSEAPAWERRRQRRAHYARSVPAFGDHAMRVLVGRDLSVGGMRIAHQPGLQRGDRLHLALYGEPGGEPLQVWGAIVRDDGDEGMALSFDPLDAADEARLERLVTGLPTVESLHDSEVDAMGTVLTEIVDSA